MNSNERTDRGSTSTVRRVQSRTRPDPQGQNDGEQTTQPSFRRQESNSSSQYDERSTRFDLPRPPRDQSEHEATRLLTRDFAEQEPTPRLRPVRSNATGFRQPIERRRLDSAQPSPSPGPAHPWRHFVDWDRKSVAIAASGRDNDTASRRFSIAGPAPLDTLIANQPYVDPGYAQLNPAYDQPPNARPVWGLAKPLPHVLRPGMVPTTDELKKEASQKEDLAESTTDLESGKIEPSLRPGKSSAQLDDVRRDREVRMFETYQQQIGSPAFSPLARPQRGSPAPARIPDIQSYLGGSIIEEDEEHQHRSSDPDLAGLSEAISEVNRAKKEVEFAMPYQDAVPLSAYDAEADEIHNLHTYWSVVRLRFREPLAELLGITVQYTLGFSANLAMTVSRGAAGAGDSTSWAWGFATMIAIYLAGGISGAHLNPAISIMLYIYRGFPLVKVPTYVTAQLLGAFFATLITFTIFKPGLIALQFPDLVLQDQHSTMTVTDANIMPPASVVLGNFLTFPRQAWVGTGTAFLTELVGTTILVVSVLALGDDTNAPPGAGMNAFIVGLLITVLSMAFGFNTGLAMNPARDFGPRVALAVLGYNTNPHPSLFADGYWFRVNWLAPICGGVLGGFIYDSMIFSGGESPVNYPPERIRRAMRKWKARWMARLGWTKYKLNTIKEEVVG